jgi:hypothetical protein
MKKWSRHFLKKMKVNETVAHRIGPLTNEMNGKRRQQNDVRDNDP